MYVRDLADMDNISPILHDIILYLQPMGNKRTARSVFGKLIFAASAYFIWLERNNKVFKKVKKSPEDIRDMVKVTVRLKLLSFRFKMTNSVELLLSRWKMPTSFRIYGDTMTEDDELAFDNSKGCACYVYPYARVVGGWYAGSSHTQIENVESAKELWDSLESKYMAEDASSKKFLVSNFNNYKMVDSTPAVEQFNELLRILGQYT
ncbi:hypothetical protein Tco_0655683 [Tanacetum coccineum]|uniref:Uncharacterized protein n=1 Tax=Tanacetum coccineum TaxID=301880 RepID=A0ABQ4X6N2_9ASTR